MGKGVLSEVYRPKTLGDVAGQSHIIKLLKGFVENKDVPHMLFSGIPGVGKTTVAKALVRDLYGSDWRNYFIEMNASDDNSISVMREKVKRYAQTRVIGQDFKVIFLDESDHLSLASQAALRRIIESNSEKCRFILSCNYPNRIIDPIKDRCTLFRFKRVEKDSMKTFLQKIAMNESIDISDVALDLLCDLSKGSMRVSIGTLEKLKSGNVLHINEDVIRNNFCYLDDDVIKTLIVKVIEGDIDVVSDFVESILYEKAYAPDEIISSLDRLLRKSKKLSDEKKAQAIIKLGEIDYRLSVGANPEIQLKCFSVYLYQLYKGS